MSIYHTALHAAVLSYGSDGTDANILKRADKFAEWLDEKTAQNAPDYTGGVVFQTGAETRDVDSFDGTFYHLVGQETGSRTLVHRSVMESLSVAQAPRVVSEPDAVSEYQQARIEAQAQLEEHEAIRRKARADALRYAATEADLSGTGKKVAARLTTLADRAAEGLL